MRTHLRLLLAVGLALPACDDASGPQTGRLSVSTHTEGDDPDADGYVLTVGEADSLELDPTGTSELDLEPGQYTLRLLDVAGHCSVAPAATLQVEVPPAGTAQITFAITCARDQGTLVVSTKTEGDDPDPDGFQLVVDGIAPLTMNPNDTAEVDLAPGHYTLQLRGVADLCSVSPRMPLEVDITGGSTTTVAFEINCPLTGTLTGARITVRTTGPDPDPEYRVLMDVGGSRLVGIPSNGTTVIQLDPGIRTIGLTDVAPNCEIDGPASHTVTIRAAEVVSVEFAVVCTARTTPGYLTGNWQLGTRSTVPGMRPMTIAGSITQSGTAVSGSVHVAGSSCFDSLTTISLTGTLAGYDISVTSTSAERQVITFTGSVTSDSLTGTYSINGGCANGDLGTVIGAKVRPINGTWRIIFNWNDQHVGLGLAGLTQATRSSEGSFAVAGTVSNSIAGSTCYEGTVTGGTFHSHSFIMGRSVTLEIETGCGTVVFRGTVNESGSGIVGHYRVFGGTDGGLSGSACLGRNIYAGCTPPPF